MKLPNVLLCLAVLILFAALAWYFTAGEPLFDFTAFWIAGHLSLHGQDPYLQSDWIPVYSQFDSLGLADNLTFLYPKPILALFLPFGALPLRTAAFIWLLLTQAAVLAALLMLAGLIPNGKRAKYLLPLFLGVVIFRPYLLTLNLGQLSGFILLALVGALLLWQRERWLAAGILLSLLALKPSPGIPILALISIWILLEKKWHHFLGLGIGGAALLAIGWVFDPGWIGRFLEIGAGKVSATFGYNPTLWGLSAYLCNQQQPCAGLSGGSISAVFMAVFVWWLVKTRNPLHPLDVMAVSVCLALWLTPYLWAYDQLLLVIPLAAAMGSLMGKRMSYLFIASMPFLLALFSIFLLNVAVGIDNDAWSALVPLFALELLSISKIIPAKEK